MKVLVIVPTYNERENIETLVRRVLTLRCPHPISVLVVDDSSPDGTAETVCTMMHGPAAGGRLFLLVRDRKAGLAGGLRSRHPVGARAELRAPRRDGRGPVA